MDLADGDPEPAGPEPRVRLFDARELGVNEAGLRRQARAHSGDSARVSRSYRHPYALVACHSRAVGVDLERLEPCDENFAASICTPQELPQVAAAPERDAFLISLWSSKEALTKALGDAVDYDPRRLAAPLFWPQGRAGPWRARQLPAPPDHVAWLCWRDGEGQAAEKHASSLVAEAPERS